MEKSNARFRFEKVAGKRVQNIINSLASLSKCSNRYNYEYSKGDVEKMIKEIKNAISITESAFKSNLSNKNSNFKF